MRIEVEIRDGINPITALECVKQVIAEGKISRDGKGKQRCQDLLETKAKTDPQK